MKNEEIKIEKFEASGNRLFDKQDIYNFESLITSGFVLKASKDELIAISEFLDKLGVSVIYQRNCQNCYLRITVGQQP